MKILYAVQGTGNGHLSRACAMARAFEAQPQVEINWLMSGRAPGEAFGVITDYQWRKGLTFVAEAGRVRMLDTFLNNDLRRFFSDIRALNLACYDLIISDFEPVVSHAAKKRGIPVTGIGHQYAFSYDIPVKGANPISRYILAHYAPASRSVGLHWHHFGFPLLPPLIDMQLPDPLPQTIPNKILVYLPFEDPQRILALFRGLREYDVHIYHPRLHRRDEGHLHCRPISRDGFKQDLLTSTWVVSNSGFELIGECLQLGKKILCKPLHGQMEQLSNARALEQLGYAEIVPQLDELVIRRWLGGGTHAVRISYPDVAAALARWIAEGCQGEIDSLSARLWGQTRVDSAA